MSAFIMCDVTTAFWIKTECKTNDIGERNWSYWEELGSGWAWASTEAAMCSACDWRQFFLSALVRKAWKLEICRRTARNSVWKFWSVPGRSPKNPDSFARLLCFSWFHQALGIPRDPGKTSKFTLFDFGPMRHKKQRLIILAIPNTIISLQHNPTGPASH